LVNIAIRPSNRCRAVAFSTYRQIAHQKKRGSIGLIGRIHRESAWFRKKKGKNLRTPTFEAGDHLRYFVCDVYPKWLASGLEDPSWEIGRCTGPVPFAIVIGDFSFILTSFRVSVSSRELLSGRALRIASKPGQDAAEFKNGEFLLRTWLNDYNFFTASKYFSFPFGSDRITT
jgi:hypothetical protein